MTAPLTPGTARMIVDNLQRLARSADDRARIAELEAQRWREAAVEARQHFGLAR